LNRRYGDGTAHGKRLAGRGSPRDEGWSEVGSADAVRNIIPKDASGNVTRDDLSLDDKSDTCAHSEGRSIACLGAQDLIVVEAADTVLVVDKTRLQDVKTPVGRGREGERTEAADHSKGLATMGYCDSINRGLRYQIKRIVVTPGAMLFLQLHCQRSEHWIVVSGTARVAHGDEVFLPCEKQSTYMPAGGCIASRISSAYCSR
jgi:mannose-1-phosphate guanylyltransferase / mannose-6-phosphate isomerase